MPVKDSGFTLPELLTTLATLSLLATFGVPGVQQYRGNQQLAAASNTLAATCAYARSESIKRRLPVLIVNGDGDWAGGWQVFVDLNDSDQLDPDEPLLLQEAPLPNGIVAKGNSPVQHYIRYTSSGSAKLLGGAFQAGTLTLCHTSGTQAIRRLVLSASGRLRREKNAPGTC